MSKVLRLKNLQQQSARGLHYYLSLITAQANCFGRKLGFW